MNNQIGYSNVIKIINHLIQQTIVYVLNISFI